jgi:AraC family 4-hydroxyphenylacetate 3-monooxygenase operon regulatory protein
MAAFLAATCRRIADRYFQMHFLDTGQIELQLDDHRYSVQAPLFVITPPSVPHAFIRVR